MSASLWLFITAGDTITLTSVPRKELHQFASNVQFNEMLQEHRRLRAIVTAVCR